MPSSVRVVDNKVPRFLLFAEDRVGEDGTGVAGVDTTGEDDDASVFLVFAL